MHTSISALKKLSRGPQFDLGKEAKKLNQKYDKELLLSCKATLTKIQLVSGLRV